MNAGKVGGSEKAPMLQRLLQYRYSPNDELMPERDIISECMGHLYGLLPCGPVLLIHRLLYYFRIAGSDTNSTSLSYFFWELSRRADILKKLQAEVDEAMTDTGTIPSLSVLQELPYLNAFIKEGSRFFQHLVFLA
jgi:Cytochrome P450